MIARLARSKRGSAMVESAIVIPILLIITMATIQFGLVMYAGQMAEEAARYGARVGAVSQQNPGGRAAAAAGSFAQSAFSLGGPSVEILAPGGVAGSTLKVRVSYQIPNMMGGLVPGLPGRFTAHGEATTRQEGW